MSELRDIRLLVARQLDATRAVKAALIDVLNIFDAALDAEGWQAPDELISALRRLDRAVIDDDTESVEESDWLDDGDEPEFVDISDLDIEVETEDDDD